MPAPTAAAKKNKSQTLPETYEEVEEEEEEEEEEQEQDEQKDSVTTHRVPSSISKALSKAKSRHVASSSNGSRVGSQSTSHQAPNELQTGTQRMSHSFTLSHVQEAAMSRAASMPTQGSQAVVPPVKGAASMPVPDVVAALLKGTASKPVPDVVVAPVPDVVVAPVPPSQAQAPTVVPPMPPVSPVQGAVEPPVPGAVVAPPVVLPVTTPTSQVGVMTPLSLDIFVDDTETRESEHEEERRPSRRLNRRSSILSSNSDELDGQHHKKDRKKRSKEDKAKETFLLRSLIELNEKTAAIKRQYDEMYDEISHKREMLMTREGLDKAILASNALSVVSTSTSPLFRAESSTNNKMEEIGEKIKSSDVDKKFELYQADIDKKLALYQVDNDKKFETMYQADFDKNLELYQADTDKKFEVFYAKTNKALGGFKMVLTESHEKLTKDVHACRANEIALYNDVNMLKAIRVLPGDVKRVESDIKRVEGIVEDLAIQMKTIGEEFGYIKDIMSNVFKNKK